MLKFIDSQGISLFAFHGNLRNPIFGEEAGSYSGEATKAIDGRWTFIDRTAIIREGDVIYFWVYIKHEDVGYPIKNLNYTVTGKKLKTVKNLSSYYNYYNNVYNNIYNYINSNNISELVPEKEADEVETNGYLFPQLLVEPLTPKGLRISIPRKSSRD